MGNKELTSLLESIGRERGLPQSVLLEGIREAFYFAFKKRYSQPPEGLRVELDEDKEELRVLVKKVITEEVKNPAREISLEEAKKINSEAKVGDEIEVELNPVDFTRIAASTGKYVMMQQIVEKEKDKLYEEFKNKELINLKEIDASKLRCKYITLGELAIQLGAEKRW